MQVFKTCLIIMKRHIGAILTYLLIFIPFSVVISSMYTEQYNTSFEEAMPNYTIINRDKETPIIKGLEEYLKDKGTNVVLEDEKETLQDANFFHETEYIVIIPNGFSEKLFTDEEISIETVSSPDSIDGYYLDMLINQYFNLATGYHISDSSLSEEQIVTNILNDLSKDSDVEMLQYTESTPVPDGFKSFYRFLPYIIMILIILCTSTVIMAFSQTEVRMRNMSSPLKSLSLSFQLMLYNIIVSIGCWLVLNGFGLIIHAGKLPDIDIRTVGLILLNSFMYMIITMALSLLVCSFIKDMNTQNFITNMLSLALSFLGGSFVPLELLGSNILAVSKFTPAYWYNVALDNICSLSDYSFTTLKPILTNMLIQLGFAVAFICISLVINKRNNSSANSFGSVKSSVEA